MSRISRRGFLGGAIAGIASAQVQPAQGATDAPDTPGEPPVAPPDPAAASERVPLSFRCNDRPHEQPVGADDTALQVIRRGAGQTGAKLGCGAGTCGAGSGGSGS